MTGLVSHPGWRCLVALLVLTPLRPEAALTVAEPAAPALQLASGLTASVWAAEPMLQNPVAISFDDHGRCYVAETHRWSESIFDVTKQTAWLTEDLSFRTVMDRSNFLVRTFATNLTLLTKDSERIRWIEDAQGLGRAGSSGRFAEGFQSPTSGTAAGILAHGQDVWFACIPDLWRMHSDSPSGQASTRDALHTGFGVHVGVSGHDLHGLKWGPDGRLYFSIGDRGFDLGPAGTQTTARPSGWKFSFHQPDTGAVLRCDPDGSNLEVFAIGLRNPQELTFDAGGNLWTGDNDTAGADDSRLVYVVEGGDYGWRCGYQHLAGFGPWVGEDLWRGGIDDALPTAGLVSQGPAGIDFYPGTGLSLGGSDQFLMCDFPGGVWSFSVTNQGASFGLGNRRKFAWNLWPTDVEFGPDGAVYIADWVFGWDKPAKGRIYRISSPQLAQDSAAAETQRLLKEGIGHRSDSDLAGLLKNPDQRVRLRAQWTLAERGARGLEAFSGVLGSNLDSIAKFHAIWGLGQIARLTTRRSDGPNVSVIKPIERALTTLLDSPDVELRAQAAKELGDIPSHGGIERLVKVLNDPAPRVRFFAAISVGKRSGHSGVDSLVEMLRTNDDRDPYVRHAGVMGLLGTADALGLLRLRQDASTAVRRAALLGLRRLQRPEVTQFLSDPDPSLVYLAARAVNDVPINEGLSQLAAFLGKIDAPSNILTRAINANFLLGDARNATVLANFANRLDAPEAMRISALEALADWAKPSPIDRIVGLWRALPSRSLEPARRALRSVSTGVYQAKSDGVKVAAMKAAAKLGVKEVGHGIFEFLNSPHGTVPVRVEALRSLSALRHSRWGEALKLGLADDSPEVRKEALRLAADNPSAEVLERLPGFLSSPNDFQLRQTAITVLGRVEDPRANEMLRDWAKRLAAGNVEPELALDAWEAIQNHRDPQLEQSRLEFERVLSGNGVLGVYQPMLHGGDSTKGRALFLDKAELACLRCHRVSGNGGIAGPGLDGVGKRMKREEIVESIVHPNAQIAHGFEQAQITLNNGTSYVGTVKRENDSEVAIESLEDGQVTLKRSEIASRTRSLSAMPEGLEKLMTRRELRDLVEYLATLR